MDPKNDSETKTTTEPQSQLFSNPERWLNLALTELVSAAQKKKDWKTAKATIDAVKHVLFRAGEIFVSEVGEVQVFLYVTCPERNKIIAAVVTKNPGDLEYTPIKQTESHAAHDLTAAFICDFPNAVFTVDAGEPIWLFAGGSTPQTALAKRWVTLNNMMELVSEGHTKFAIAVPKSRDSEIQEGPKGTKDIKG